MLDKKFNLDVKALNKLTFFVVLPSLIFYSVYSAKIDMTMITVFIVGCVEMFFLALGGHRISPLVKRSQFAVA